MAAYAALVSLKNILEQIQRQTRFPISIDEKQVESLHEKVDFLIDFLEGYSYFHDGIQEANDLERRITDAAYAAEDNIETHVVNEINATSFSLLYSLPLKRKREMVGTSTGEAEITPTLSCPGLEKVMQDVDFIKEEVMKIKDGKGIEDLKPKSPITAHSSSSIPFEKNTMVGFVEELTRMMEQLTGHQSSRQVIPLVGMGGIGKTTLAKTVYEKPFIMRRFDILAWITISQEFSLRQILLGLLATITTGFNHLSEEQLADRLYKSLCGMRYLVVLDDMWSLKAWEMVMLFLPDNNNGSRIIVTTRLSSVATHFGSCGIEMNFLDEDKGWDLLSEKVFAQDACPLEFEEVGRKIARNCKGLPLSIVVIGGLLAKSERTKEYWEYIARDTSSIINSEDDERCMKILSLSYQNLPIHLKPCFLYVGAFPEDKEFRVSDLIHLWVAEGFLKPNSSKDLEVVGKDYLNNLISRNLIFVHKRGSNGKIKLCNIHDLLRDLCLREAHKEKFMYVQRSLDNIRQDVNSQRRTSIHQSSSKVEHVPQVLNTVKLRPLARTLISDLNEDFPLQTFGLLRVLKVADKYQVFIDKRNNKYLPDNIFQLVNLRYVAFNALLKLRSSFPSSLYLLWNLQILIVKETWASIIAPLEIWELTELRHLEFDIVHLADPSCQQTDRRDDATLKNLQTLMGIENFRFTDEAIKRIPNIKKLKISCKNVIGAFEEYCLKNLGLLKKLESLACYFPPEKRPTRTEVLSHLSFPSSLKKLTLFNTKLHWEDMTLIGSLPHLEVLKLKYGSFKGPEWTPVEGEFCRLKFLKIDRCDELVYWIAEDTHFPRLEHLVLQLLHKLVEIPSGIGETLQSIQLVMCSDSLVKSAKEILEEQEDLGNVGLQVRVLE